MEKSYSYKLKKALAGISSLCIAYTGMTFTSASAKTMYLGDANLDGSINAVDAVMVQKHVLGYTDVQLDATATKLADANQDGNVDISDVVAIRRMLVNGKLTSIEIADSTTDITYIHLNGTSATVEGNNASVSGGIVTISASGTYYVDGTLTDGQIKVNVADTTTDTGTVKLFLNGANISGLSQPAIYVENAENTSINLVDGTTNSVSDGTAVYSSTETLAAIYSKDDLTIKGSTGVLNVTANTQYGIHCNNDLKFNGGVVNVTTSAADAVRGQKSVTVNDGTLTIDSEGDGIKSTQGNVSIAGGTISCKAANDAVQAETTIDISAGTVVASGDRGLTAVTAANITGGNVLVTSTDSQVTNLKATQGTMLLDYAADTTSTDGTWKKSNKIAVSKDGKEIFSATPTKKFKYAIVSNSALASGSSYTVTTGGASVTHSTASTAGTFTLSAASTEFTDVKTISGSATTPTTDGYTITLSNSGLSTNAPETVATVANNVLTIIKPGVFTVSGEMTGGQIVVNVDKTTYADGVVELDLSNANLTNTTTSPIYVASIGDECAIVAKNGTSNTISDGTSYTNADGGTGAIYSCDDLKIKGQGTLTVNGNCADAIVCKNDLKLYNGTIIANAVDDAIRGKDSVTVGNDTDTDFSSLKITAKSTAGDGIKANETDTDTKGVITFNGGTIDVTAYYDAVHAARTLNVNGGDITITTTCPASGSSTSSGSSNPWGGGGMQEGNSNKTAKSAKGLKAGANVDATSTTAATTVEGTINIKGGNMNITSADDSVHATNVNVTAGKITASSGDDGVHADKVLTLGTAGGSDSDFSINVTKSYEGIEGADIEIKSGSTSVVSSDDGFNGAGGSDSSGTTNPGGWGQGGMSTSSGVINMSGGYIYSRASGDGFDSNGNITVSGGTLLVCGPTSGGNGIFDYGDSGCSFTHTGGIIFGMGTSDMAVYPNSTYISANGTLSANSVIAVADSSGKTLAALTVPADMNMSGLVIFSNASASSSTYSIYSGGTYSGTLDSHGYGTGGTITGGTKLTAGSGSSGGGRTNPWG